MDLGIQFRNTLLSGLFRVHSFKVIDLVLEEPCDPTSRLSSGGAIPLCSIRGKPGRQFLMVNLFLIPCFQEVLDRLAVPNVLSNKDEIVEVLCRGLGFYVT